MADSVDKLREALAREEYYRQNNLALDAQGREKKIEAPKIIAETPKTGHFAMVAMCNEHPDVEMRQLSDTIDEKTGQWRVNLICPKCWDQSLVPKKIDQVEPRERDDED